MLTKRTFSTKAYDANYYANLPFSPAYLVFHDAHMNGAMDVYPFSSLEEATDQANCQNEYMESRGADEDGSWRAYEKLPRKRVWKFHAR
jgi:hypothetical protein